MNNWLASIQNHPEELSTERSARGPAFAQKLLHPSLSQLAAVDSNLPVHLRYSHNCGYDDYHKSFRAIGNQWPHLSYPKHGPPRIRQGRQGGSWRHVKEVMQAGGSRKTFIDGCIANDDRFTCENIPGGDLIKPISKESRRATWIYGLTSKPRENTYRKPVIDVETQRAIEHTNWNIMR